MVVTNKVTVYSNFFRMFAWVQKTFSRLLSLDELGESEDDWQKKENYDIIPNHKSKFGREEQEEIIGTTTTRTEVGQRGEASTMTVSWKPLAAFPIRGKLPLTAQPYGMQPLPVNEWQIERALTDSFVSDATFGTGNASRDREDVRERREALVREIRYEYADASARNSIRKTTRR